MGKKATLSKNSGSRKKKAETPIVEDAIALEDQPDLESAVEDESLGLEDDVVEADDVAEVRVEVVSDDGEKAVRAKVKDETVLRQWCITGLSIDGKKVVLGKYYTESEATPDRDRIVADGFYHDVRVSPIPAPPQA